MSGAPVPMSYGDGKPCARVDLKKASQVDDVSLDDMVTIVVKGKVKSLRGGEQYKTRDYDAATEKGREKQVTRIIPGSIEVEVDDMRVQSESAFAGMLKDYDE